MDALNRTHSYPHDLHMTLGGHVGNRDGLHWDDEKSDLLAEIRGYQLYDVAENIFSNEYVEYQHRGYPEQSRAVGRVDGKLRTLVYAFVEDDFGSFVKLITYWPMTRSWKRHELDKRKVR